MQMFKFHLSNVKYIFEKPEIAHSSPSQFSYLKSSKVVGIYNCTKPSSIPIRQVGSRNKGSIDTVQLAVSLIWTISNISIGAATKNVETEELVETGNKLFEMIIELEIHGHCFKHFYFESSLGVFKKTLGNSRSLFSLFSYFQCSLFVQLMVNEIANDWT